MILIPIKDASALRTIGCVEKGLGIVEVGMGVAGAYKALKKEK